MREDQAQCLRHAVTPLQGGLTNRRQSRPIRQTAVRHPSPTRDTGPSLTRRATMGQLPRVSPWAISFCPIAALTCLLLFGADTANAARPSVVRTEPMGVVRGTTTQVIVHGDRLGDAYQVLFDRPGLSVAEVKPIDAKQVELTVVADEQMQPGLYPLQVVTKSGISNLRLIGVGSLPVVQEVEPNSQVAEAQKIELNTTVEGLIKFEDVDYFEVQLRAGQTVHVEVEGLRLSYDFAARIFDPYVAIQDEDQFEVAASDDSAFLLQDPLCSFTAPSDGTYKVVIRDSSFGGNDLAYYRAHIGTFPRPVAIMPSGGQPGQKITATYVYPTGDSQEPIIQTAEIQLPEAVDEAFGVVTSVDQLVSPSPNWIRINDLPVTVESEPNDDLRKGNPAIGPGALCGTIGTPGDIDFFTFEAEQGVKYLVKVFARGTLRSPLDSVVNVYGPDFKGIGSNDDANRMPDSYLEFTAAAAGPHTVRITDSLKRGGPTFVYRIEVTKAEPRFTLNRREIYRDEPHGISVPQGGSMAVMITAARENFGSELLLELGELPAGITATTYPMIESRAEVPLILSAAADASHANALVPVNAKSPKPELADLVGGLKLRNPLVLGRNRVDMWGYDSARFAVAVTNAAPFKITLHQPGTPIVRNGSKDLRVSIERHEGFEGEVSLATLYTPPGIAVNNGRKIDKGANEVMVPVTANGSAAVGTWPMILIATYDSGNGPGQIAAGPINLEIADVAFQFEFPRVAGETGTEMALALGVEVMREFAGTGELELVGLPPGVTSPAIKQPLNPDSTSVTFPLVIAADAKVGNHKTLHCVARIVSDAGDIVQTMGTGEIRIDEPLKTAAAPAQPAPAADAAPAPPKPLSRIEQLRQMKAETAGGS